MNSTNIDTLLNATQNANPKQRRAALLQLCPCHVRTNVPEVWDRIIAMCSDVDAGVRSIALHNLCDGSPRDRQDEIVAVVESLANDQNLKIRRRARRAMAIYRRTGNINIE